MVEFLHDKKMSSSLEDIERGVPLVTRPTEYRPEEDDRKLQEVPNWTLKERIVTTLAGTTSLLSLFTMLALPNPITYISSIMGLILPPYSAFLQQKITECEALHEINESMDRELSNLKYENERLTSICNGLQSSVTNFKEMQSALEVLRTMEDISLDELQSQLLESQEILKKLETSLVGMAIQNILSVIMACDFNQDNTLQDEEMERLIRSLESMEGIKINKSLLKGKIIERGRNLNAVVELIRDLLEEKEDKLKPIDQRIFIFE